MNLTGGKCVLPYKKSITNKVYLGSFDLPAQKIRQHVGQLPCITLPRFQEPVSFFVHLHLECPLRTFGAYLRPERRRGPRLLPIFRLCRALMRRACFRKKAFQHHNGYRHQSPGQNTIEIKNSCESPLLFMAGGLIPKLRRHAVPCGQRQCTDAKNYLSHHFLQRIAPIREPSRTIMRKRSFKSVDIKTP